MWDPTIPRFDVVLLLLLSAQLSIASDSSLGFSAWALGGIGITTSHENSIEFNAMAGAALAYQRLVLQYRFVRSSEQALLLDGPVQISVENSALLGLLIFRKWYLSMVGAVGLSHTWEQLRGQETTPQPRTWDTPRTFERLSLDTFGAAFSLQLCWHKPSWFGVGPSLWSNLNPLNPRVGIAATIHVGKLPLPVR